MFALEKKYYVEMISHAEEEAPSECCGLLAGQNYRIIKLYRTTNAEHSPVRYKIEPLEEVRIFQEMREKGWELLGIYHSHPHSAAYPSPVDVRQSFFPQVLYFIVSLAVPMQPVVRVFRIEKSGIKEEELTIEENKV